MNLKSIHIEDSTLMLLLTNLIVIGLVMRGSRSIIDIMATYLIESLVIGLFIFIALLYQAIKSVSKKGAFEGTPKVLSAVFFLPYYGIFHIVYIAFLWVFSTMDIFGKFNLNEVLLFSSILAFGHLYSFIKNSIIRREINDRVDASDVYTRIFPLHLTIIASGVLIALVPHLMIIKLIIITIFMTLKTIVDLGLHMNKHHLLR